MESIKSNLPDELMKTLNCREFDDEAGLLIESLNYVEQDLYFNFSINFYEKETDPHLWEVVVKNIEEECIKRDWTQNLSIYTEHILLLKYHDPYMELYLKGTTNQDEKLFIEIYNSINALSDNPDHISEYILPPQAIYKLCNQGDGLFARGPKTVMKLYADKLTKHNIKPIFIGDENKKNKDAGLKLLELGKSYFVGSDFLFKRKS